MSETCPNCGAGYNGRPAQNRRDYWCSSTTWNDGDFYQSPECVRRERDLLLEWNLELVQALSAMEMWVPTHCENQVVAEARAVLAKHKEAKP